MLEQLASKRQEITNVAENVEKREPLSIVGMLTGAAIMENSTEIPQKTKNKSAILSSNSTSGYLPKENENTNSKRYMHPYV